MRAFINRPYRTLLAAAMVALALPAGSALALEVKALQVKAGASATDLRIELDQQAQYQVFDLEAPTRLVLNLPGATLNRAVEPIRNPGAGVANVFPIQDKDGVRIEVGLDQKLKYDVREDGTALVIHFAKPAAGPAGGGNMAATIKDIDVQDRGDTTELVLHGDHMDANHNAYMTNNGRTMIIDFWGGSSMLPKEHYGYASRKIAGVNVGAAEGRVRLVVNLLPGGQATHQIEAKSNEMVVRFGQVAPAAKGGTMTVEGVNFEPEDRIAHLLVRTDGTNPVVDLREKDGNVIVDIRKATLAQGQEKSQDVSAFPGPVRQVDSYNNGHDVRIVARLRDKVVVSSFQSGNLLTINLEPQDLVAARKRAGGETAVYHGKKVTFDFKDIEIRNAIKLIAEMSDLNIIMSNDVSGTLTMRLIDVPWDQALDLILVANGLGKEQTGNVMRIAPIEVLQKEYKTRLAANKGAQDLEPLITEYIHLGYASVEDMKKLLESSKSSAKTEQQQAQEGAAAGTSASQTSGLALLSSRGSILMDQRTNTLIVTDTADRISNIKRLVAELDKPVRQVLIAARIVEASDNFTRQLGVRWGGGFASAKQAAGGGSAIQLGAGNAVTPPTGARGFLVDLPAAGAAPGPNSFGGTIGASIGAVNKALNLDLELSAAESDGLVKIVSNPRIVATNGQSATISSGTDIPYVTPGTPNTPATTTFKKAELRLTVTPQVAPDNSINLQVDITKDSPNSTTGTVVIDTRQIQTNLQVQNGDTIVIGGIYTQDQRNNEGGIPLLKDIPLLGYLFKRTEKVNNRSELLIFLTPTVVKEMAGVAAGGA